MAGSNTAVASSITSTNGGMLLQGDGAAILQGVKVDAAKDITIQGGAVSIIGLSAAQMAQITSNIVWLSYGLRDGRVPLAGLAPGEWRYLLPHEKF